MFDSYITADIAQHTAVSATSAPINRLTKIRVVFTSSLVSIAIRF